jgi:hypothetical protein
MPDKQTPAALWPAGRDAGAAAVPAPGGPQGPACPHPCRLHGCLEGCRLQAAPGGGDQAPADRCCTRAAAAAAQVGGSLGPRVGGGAAAAAAQVGIMGGWVGWQWAGGYVCCGVCSLWCSLVWGWCVPYVSVRTLSGVRSLLLCNRTSCASMA